MVLGVAVAWNLARTGGGHGAWYPPAALSAAVVLVVVAVRVDGCAPRALGLDHRLSPQTSWPRVDRRRHGIRFSV
jgi:hypothetical protein